MTSALEPTASITLVSYEICPFVQRAVILLNQAGLDYDIKFVDLTNKPDWFKAISPTGQVPLLCVGDTVLFESQVIVEYLADVTGTDLWPSHPLKKAQQKAFIAFSSRLISSQWMMNIAPDEARFLQHKNELNQQLQRLENTIVEQSDFVQHTPHSQPLNMLDIAFGPLLQRLKFIEADVVSTLFKRTPNLNRWAENLISHPNVLASTPHALHQKITQRIHHENGFLAKP